MQPPRLPCPDLTGEMVNILEFLCNSSTVNERGCWVWNFSKNKLGYPNGNYGGRNWVMTRLAWCGTVGAFDPMLYVCHDCDNPSCCNPAHLWLGTHTDNQRDMVKKGRHSKGKKTHCMRGHELVAPNMVVRGGHRVCRQCELGRLRVRSLGWPKDLAFALPPQSQGYIINPNNTTQSRPRLEIKLPI